LSFLENKLFNVKFVDELPQWITSSDVGAYHPFSKTIWIRTKLGVKRTIIVFIHEMCHWIIDIIFNNDEKLHNKLDENKLKSP